MNNQAVLFNMIRLKIKAFKALTIHKFMEQSNNKLFPVEKISFDLRKKNQKRLAFKIIRYSKP